jgi:methylmalonyl-CoA mutase N-terminal domain/subunit
MSSAEGEARAKVSSRQRWADGFAKQSDHKIRINRSGMVLQPIYGPADEGDQNYRDRIGYPGQEPYTRGIYPAMYLGRGWSRRMLIGLGTPEDFNLRQKEMLASGTNAVNFIPCNSVFRGYDIDQVEPLLVGTCGTAVNTIEDMRIALDGIDIGSVSIGMNDPSPFTLTAFTLLIAEERGTPWAQLSGTSNQADFISHFVANHMFYRLSLEGSRRVLVDHIRFMTRHIPSWNPLSIVGQHMQQAGATPAQALGFSLSSSLYYIDLCLAAGMSIDEFVHRFTFFFDVSISFFEEVAKFRAGRRLWAKLLKQRYGAKSDRSLRFKFHAQTSGVDLTRQQPYNNIARVAIQGLAAILGGMQSLHTDGYDEAIATPSSETARIAIMTQNILAEETGVTDVIDPLGGSWYIENLTDEMEARALDLIAQVDSLGGMFEAVKCGFVQNEIGKSALHFQQRVESGEQTVVGVNKYTVAEEDDRRRAVNRPDPAAVERQYQRLARFKRERCQQKHQAGLDGLARSAQATNLNIYEAVVGAIRAGATHGEVVSTLRRELGFGQPLMMAE